jgi:hypothetical protein
MMIIKAQIAKGISCNYKQTLYDWQKLPFVICGLPKRYFPVTSPTLFRIHAPSPPPTLRGRRSQHGKTPIHQFTRVHLHDKLPGIFFQIFSWWRLKSGRKQKKDPQLLKFSWQPGVIISGWSWSSISPCSVVGRNFRSFKGLRKSASRRSLKSHACAI